MLCFPIRNVGETLLLLQNISRLFMKSIRLFLAEIVDVSAIILNGIQELDKIALTRVLKAKL